MNFSELNLVGRVRCSVESYLDFLWLLLKNNTA